MKHSQRSQNKSQSKAKVNRVETESPIGKSERCFVRTTQRKREEKREESDRQKEKERERE